MRSMLAVSLVWSVASTGVAVAQESCQAAPVGGPSGWEPCPLPPGAYAPEGLTVPVQLTIDESWLRVRSLPTEWVIVRADDILGYLVGPITVGEEGDSITSADEMVTTLLGYDRLEVAEPEATEVGGRAATSMDVTVVGDLPFEVLLQEDLFHLQPGDQARMVFLDVDGTLVGFTVEGYGEGGLDSAIDGVQGILDSVTWAAAPPEASPAT